MDQKTIDILKKEIEVHYKQGPNNIKYPYVVGKDVISRLNEAFQHDWSSKVLETIKDDNTIIILLQITHGDVSHEGFGGGNIMRYSGGQNAGKPVDMANAYKSAFTNALKKAAEQFGVGLVDDGDDVAPVSSPNNQHTNTNINNRPPSPPRPTTPKVEGTTTVSSASVAEFLSGANSNALIEAVQREFSKDQAPRSNAPVQPVNKPQNGTFAKSGNGNGKINDIQAGAINGLLKAKKMTLEDASNKALNGNIKSTIEMLTQEEAKSIISFLNNLR